MKLRYTFLYGAGMACVFIGVSEIGESIRQSEIRAQQKDIYERVAAHCEIRGRRVAKTNTGEWMCADSAPAFSMSMPVKGVK